MHFHLYTPLHSVHPPGVAKKIYGLIKTYWEINTDKKYFIDTAAKLYVYFFKQGYQPYVLNKFFSTACACLTNKQNVQQSDYRQNLFYHLQHHPKDIQRQNICLAYQQNLKQLLPNQKLTICISWPPNL